MRRQKRSSAMLKKIVVMFAAVVLIVAATISGTLAWLTDDTDTVTNTFTVGNIDISLTETFNAKSEEDLEKNDIWEGKILPGNVLTKDPKVSVTADSEDCYLFVLYDNDTSLIEGSWFTSNLSESNGWIQGTGTEGNGVPTNVWYRIVLETDNTREWHLIEDDTITIPETLTKSDIDAMIDKMGETQTITYMACAVQLKNNGVEFSPRDAYAKAPKTFTDAVTAATPKFAKN